MHLLLLFQGRFDSTNDPDNQKKNSIDNGTKQIAPTATIETYSIFIILPFNFEWTFKTNEESRMRKEASGNDLVWRVLFRIRFQPSLLKLDTSNVLW